MCPEEDVASLGRMEDHPGPSQLVLEEDSLFLGDTGARSELGGQCQVLAVREHGGGLTPL